MGRQLTGDHRKAVVDIEAAWDAVVRAANRSRAHDRLVHRAGVSMDRAGWALLRQLGAAECELRPTDLADLLDIDLPWVTRKLQQLQQTGLVARSADNEDRRASRLALTDRGRAVLSRLLSARRQQLGETLSGWDDRDIVTFAGLLCRFAKDIDRAVERHPTPV